MTKWVSLKELLQDTRKYDEMSRLFIDYTPSGGKLTFKKEETGSSKEQTAEVEVDLGGWHPFLSKKGKLCLVSHNATIFKLQLKGLLGYENGPMLIRKYGKKYGCKKLGITGGAINEEDFNKLNKYLRETCKKNYWLADKEIYYTKPEIINACVVYVDCAQFAIDKCLYSSNHDFSQTLAIRPKLFLPEYTLVDMGDEFFNGKTKAKAIKMKFTSSQQIAQENEIAKEILLKRIIEVEESLSALKQAMEELK